MSVPLCQLFMSYQSNTTVNNSQVPGSSALAIIALGANQDSPYGAPADTICLAMDEIAGWSDTPSRRSSLWSSDPVDCPPGSPGFINAVIAIHTHAADTPLDLLTRLQHLENRLGRKAQKAPNAPRCIDLDLICFGEQICNEPHLILPHPRAHLRGFVIFPLEEIAPDLVFPLKNQRITDIAAGLRKAGESALKLESKNKGTSHGLPRPRT